MSQDRSKSADATNAIVRDALSLRMIGVALAVLLWLTSVSFAGSDSVEQSSATNSKVRAGETLTGKASYYPNRLNGRKTSSGETFHQSDHTAASNRLPLGTHVEVTNLKNGKSTEVRVIDRGPALGRHSIDLSRKAAHEIGLTRKEGKVPVTISVTHPPVSSTRLPGSP